MEALLNQIADNAKSEDSHVDWNRLGEAYYQRVSPSQYGQRMSEVINFMHLLQKRA